MYVPVQLRSRVEGWVYPREEVARDSGGDIFVGDVVDGVCECNFVVMQRQRLEMEVAGKLLDVRYEDLWPWEPERIVHRSASDEVGEAAAEV